MYLKVWFAELEIIAKIAMEHDLLVFSDEVYQHWYTMATSIFPWHRFQGCGSGR